MQVIVRDADKLKAIIDHFPGIWIGRVLDVGCRDKRLRNLMPCQDPPWTPRYYSLDINSRCKPDITADIGAWPDYEKYDFHVVAALDVLEHTDNICAAFKHICSMSSGHVLISLPNLYYWKHRIKFLLGKTHSGKYGLPVIEGCKADRHRWLFTLPNAREFVYVHASAYNFRIVEEVCLTGPRFRHLKLLPKWWPTLFTQTYVVLLERRYGNESYG